MKCFTLLASVDASNVLCECHNMKCCSLHLKEDNASVLEDSDTESRLLQLLSYYSLSMLPQA